MLLRPSLRSADVLYSSNDYLPPLDTGGQVRKLPVKGDPAFARQPIISVPSNPDNSHQTIVTPPQVRLTQDVPLPNIVAWSQDRTPIAPAAIVPARAELKAPELPQAIIAPPPEVRSDRRATPTAPQPAIIEPPPSTATSSLRKFGDVNIGHSEVVAPAPQLPMSEQRTFASLSSGGSGGAVVPPPPTIASGGPGEGSGRLIALGINPLPPSSTIEVPAGNRLGAFAATPEGKPGAAGTPNVEGVVNGSHAGAGGGGNGSGGGGSGDGSKGQIPSGLYVGAGKNLPDSPGAPGGTRPDGQPAKDPNLRAEAAPPRVSSVPRHPATADDSPTDAERKVFGVRRFYSMSLNMPNLNSGGGSWVIRFAELRQSQEKGVLMAPVATQKVDPAYPAALMRENVEGTVTLYAVIHSDGSVGDVRVIQSVDDRLDTYASTALSRWRFLPAVKNGSPVAVEAVVMIPFRAIRRSIY